jgi:nucleoid-associated protein YgaU
VQKSVTETARFTVDIVDGDNTITLPDVSPERSRDPNIIIQKDGSSLQQNTPPQSSPQQNTPPQNGTDNDVYQEYLRNYYNQNGTPSQSINEPLGGVHPGQQPGNQPQTTAPPITSSQSYTIRRGDTLYKIARSQMGDGEKWRILCDLNFSGNKSQCDNLLIGQVIKLP